MRSDLTRNISALVVADVIGKILPFLSFPYLVRVLGQELFGKYGFALSITGLVLLLASPGLVPFGTRAAAQNDGGEAVLAAKINGLRAAFLALSLIVFSFYMLFAAPEDPQTRLLLVMCSLAAVPTTFSQDWLLTGKSIISPVAVAGVVGQIGYTVVIFVGVRSQALFWIVPVATIVSTTLSSIVVYYVVRKHFGLSWPTISWTSAKEIVPTSLVLGFASTMSMMYDKIDTVILGYSRSMEEVGLYTATYKLMWVVMSFQPILSKVFFPIIAKSVGQSGVEDDNSSLYLKMIAFISFPIMIGGVFLATPLTELILGKEYQGAGFLFALLVPNVLAGGLAIYYAGIKLVAFNKNKEYLLAVASGAIINLALNLVLIPKWGVAAAALTTILSQTVVAGSATWMTRQNRGPSFLKLAWLPLFLSCVMLLPLIGLKAIFPHIHVAVLVGVGGLSYGGLWLLVGRFKNHFN